MAAATLAVCGSAASAATFDFDAMGDAFEASFDNFAVSGSAGMLTDDGVTITDMSGGPADHYAYLDGGSKNGLGSCSVNYSTDQDCSGNFDDNLAYDESVSVTFDQIVQASSILVWGNHVDFVSGYIMINGDQYAVTNGVVDITGLAASTIFTFADPVDGQRNGTEAYIRAMTVAAVPIPAAGFLLLGGLGGLAALRRRKKA